MPVSKNRSGKVALAHCRGEDRCFGVFSQLIFNRFGGHVGVRTGRAFLEGHLPFVAILELWRRVEQHRVFRGRLEAVALFGHDVQQHRAIDAADHLQIFAQQANVVAVDGTHVTKSQIFEHHPAAQAGLRRFLELHEETFGGIAQ
jgi:hypothetical protein